jgi:hypothetical protein
MPKLTLKSIDVPFVKDGGNDGVNATSEQIQTND